MAEEPKPKIIIDEDWKTQVEREKEELERKQKEAPPRPAAETAPGALPATFEVLVTALASEAMLFLGQMPHPSTGQPVLDLPHARHLIDTLGMLEDKTLGNLTPEEARLLHGVLHDLRVGFVTIEQAVAQGQSPGNVTP
jgi:hypothetical protein